MIDFQQTFCLFNNTLVTFDKLSEYILVELNFKCSTHILLITAASLLGVTVIAVLLSIFLYRHRWDIRYWCLNVYKKRNRNRRLDEMNTNYVFDAFVSYADGDRGWVINQLAKHLEKPEAGQMSLSSVSAPPTTIKLCLSDRDFVPGESIQQNIIEKTEASRKVILVLSDNFLRSEWCKMELEIAHMHGLDRGLNILVPIMLSPLTEDLPCCLNWHIRRNTYIEWEENSSETNEFWNRLRRAVRDSGSETWICECGKTIFSNDSHVDNNAMPTNH